MTPAFWATIETYSAQLRQPFFLALAQVLEPPVLQYLRLFFSNKLAYSWAAVMRLRPATVPVFASAAFLAASVCCLDELVLLVDDEGLLEELVLLDASLHVLLVFQLPPGSKKLRATYSTA